TAKTACLAAGMNDYISKPIEPEQLFKVLSRWIRPDFSGRKSSPATKKFKRAGSALPGKLPGIDITSALRRLGGNEDLLIRLLRTFLRNQKETGAALKKALNANDYKTARRLAHTVKGVAGNLSAMKLFEAAGRLEELISRGKAAHPAKLLPLFNDAMAEVFSSITIMEKKQKKGGKEQTGKKAGNKKAAALLLTKLNNLLAQNNLEATVVFKSLTPFIDTGAYGDDWRKIEERIDELDFAGAQKALRRIALKTGLAGGGK
ncbi:MAG TPA: Hpt domain-containing protein, partial [Smithellaceae bacterium]|nr:Hpt domain-containing protein [Smithellaceae bacterium]